MLVLYRCSYDDCAMFGIVKEIREDEAGNLVTDSARNCRGIVASDNRECGRLLDRLPDGVDGDPEHVASDRPEPPVEQVGVEIPPPAPPVQEQIAPLFDILINDPALSSSSKNALLQMKETLAG